MYKNLSFRGPSSVTAWHACFRYASAVESATVLRDRVQVRVAGPRRWQSSTEMPEVGLSGFFPLAGLTWYMTVLAVVMLSVLAALLAGGLFESFSDGMVKSPLGLAVIISGLIAVGCGFAMLLTTLRATSNCALTTAPQSAVNRFSQILAMHDGDVPPPREGATYLDLAVYGAAFRRMLAAKEVERLRAATQIARHSTFA